MLANVAEDREWFWERLLQCIEEEAVIPVVGPDLLVFPLGDRQVSLYPYLAQRLAEDLKVRAEGLPESGALNEVACRFKAGGGNIHFVYSKLKAILSRLDQPQVPEPLRKLARIRPFKLFISLTFDSLLARAINEERFAGDAETSVLSYSPAAKDPVIDLEQTLGPVVLHLFGKLSATNDYAVTEEDVLEFVHSLQAEGRLPWLLDSAPRKSLLLLGSSFPDWLTRFFLRIGSGDQRLSLAGKTDVIADFKAVQDPGLVPFIRSFSPETRIFDDPFAFVEELSERWRAAHPDTPKPPPERPLVEGGEAAVPTALPGAIFLSYASEDRNAAKALRGSLEAAGMKVWFDKEALRAGDDFEEKIFRAIRSCCVFVPLISRNTLTEEYRYFRLEWGQALRLLEGLPPNRRFLFPVAIDDTPESSDALPEKFRSPRQWARLPEGRTTEEFVAILQEEYRSHQQRQRRGP